MPHNFIVMSASTPNPGRRTRADVEAICKKHGGAFEHLWFDDDRSPAFAYVLVRDGDVGGMMDELHGHGLTRLYPGQPGRR